MSSFDERSADSLLLNSAEAPKRALTQVLKTNVGAIRYNKTTRKRHNAGNRSNRKVKNKISETNIIEPGNPKKTNKLTKLTRKSFGHKKFIPLISVISRVLKRLDMASTNKNELVDRRAWLISIQNPDRINDDCPLIIHRVNQCISTTVE